MTASIQAHTLPKRWPTGDAETLTLPQTQAEPSGNKLVPAGETAKHRGVPSTHQHAPQDVGVLKQAALLSSGPASLQTTPCASRGPDQGAPALCPSVCMHTHVGALQHMQDTGLRAVLVCHVWPGQQSWQHHKHGSTTIKAAPQAWACGTKGQCRYRCSGVAVATTLALSHSPSATWMAGPLS